MDKKIARAEKAHKDGEEHKLHGRFSGAYILDLVFGANDGIVTTFAVVAGVTGAGLNPSIVLILGFANLFADGVSMAVGNFLGRRSENDYFRAQKRVERWEIEHIPQIEKEEIRKIYERKGLSGKQLEDVMEAITNDKELWLETMLREEHGISVKEEGLNPVKHGLATFIAFVGAGLIPLLAYLLPAIAENTFIVAAALTGIAFFGVGATRTLVTQKSWWRSGLEILFIGSIAAAAAFFIGVFVEKLV